MARRPEKRPTNPLTRERRIDVRNLVEAGISLTSGGMEVMGRVKNLNLHGMFCWSPERFPDESECQFRLIVEGETQHIMVHGWVVRCTERGLAIQFREPLPEDVTAAIERILNRVQPPLFKQVS